MTTNRDDRRRFANPMPSPRDTHDPAVTPLPEALDLAPHEVAGMKEIATSLEALRNYLLTTSDPEPHDVEGWLRHIQSMRALQGNVNNDASLTAGILARRFLIRHANVVPYDASSKAQGASGLDVDERTHDGKRVIGEIKTTVAYLRKDIGAAQRTSFFKDFDKLRDTDAGLKFFFLIDRRTYEIVLQRYQYRLQGVHVVLLPDGDTEYIGHIVETAEVAR
jgi:hypothetical protein